MEHAAPVHDDRLPGHKITVGGCEKYQCPHQVIGRLQAFQGALFQLQLAQRLRRILTLVFDQAWRYGIDADVLYNPRASTMA